jgi:hypothetical protein
MDAIGGGDTSTYTPITFHMKTPVKEKSGKQYNGFTYWKSLDRVPFTEAERKDINVRNLKWASMWRSMPIGKSQSPLNQACWQSLNKEEKKQWKEIAKDFNKKVKDQKHSTS